MCGIVGLISREKIERTIVEKMNEKLKHRGPDSSGFYFAENVGLGMRRLKIIDLSGGDQPIYNENGQILVFFNGEIYNFPALRRSLLEAGHQFRTKSDTEILVHGYEEWGIEGLLDRIEGMFAFSLYDKEREKIFLVRDKFGEKPLYFFHNNREFAFASEMKSLFAVDGAQKDISPVSLYYYLALHHIPGRETILRDIFRLECGHYLALCTKSLRFEVKKYWELTEKKSFDSFKNAVEKTRELVKKSVKDRMIADVPVGAFLSGGIDSSIMVGIMAGYSRHLKTFSIGFENSRFDESPYSKEVAEYFGTDHRHFVFTEKEALESLPEVIRFMDEPIGDQALLPVLLLAKEASKHVKVVLGGEGADEIFAGYDYYEESAKRNGRNSWLNFFKSRPEADFLEESRFMTSSGFPLVSGKNDRFDLIREDRHADIFKSLKENPLSINKKVNKIKNPLKRAQYSDIYSWLADDLLIKYDRMAMAASLEGRAPYLDSKLAEFAFNLPSKYKWRGNTSKFILREAFKDLLPKNILKRKKHGFNLPMAEWLKEGLRKEILNSTDLRQDDLIETAHYKKLVENHLTGKEDRARLLYSLMVYRLWFRENVSG